jgi:c(7)-type cytochrome triheme protein
MIKNRCKDDVCFGHRRATKRSREEIMKKVFCALFVLIAASFAWGQGGVKKKRPLPQEYGRVTLNEYSPQAGMPAVVFDHWVHRKNYSCRLCHVDIGFGMTAGSTKIHAADNAKGFYCGACHNGRTQFTGKKIFEACSKEYSREEYKRCVRCHSLERVDEAFYRFAENLPRETHGNGINWEKAENDGLIKLVDTLEGVSVPKPKMKVQQDISLKAKVDGMPDIIFSHTKHTVWSGCELCHPDIFVGIRKGTTKYSMVDLFEGRYCGVCHGKVAFPQTDCQRCHATPVGG